MGTSAINRGGRPRKEPGREAVPVTLERRHMDILDRAIDGPTGGIERATEGPHERGALRRARLGRMIDEHLTADTLHPVAVRVDPPIYCRGTAKELRDAADEIDQWRQAQEAHLTATAPPLVRAGLAMHRFQRLRESDPEHAADARAEANWLLSEWKAARADTGEGVGE